MQMHLVNSSLILCPFPEMNSYLCLSSLYTLSWVISFNNDLTRHLGAISPPDADNIQIYIFNPNPFLSFKLICLAAYLTSSHGCASFPSKLICPNLFIFLYFLSWWNYLITQFSKPENCGGISFHFPIPEQLLTVLKNVDCLLHIHFPFSNF